MRTRRNPVDLAQSAVARAQQLADDWGRHGPPRRPRNGHTANCPRWLEPVRWGRRCGLCWAEGNGCEKPVIAITTTAATSVDMPAELRACPRCYRPTTSPEDHCP